jgi:hypothetical protein
MGTEEIAGHVAITALIHLAEKLYRLRFLKCRIIARNSDIRVSFASLLVIQDGGRFVLIRNLRRPEAFAPLGGVLKYHDEAKPDLDSFEFRPEDYGPGEIMKSDLRGYLPRRFFPQMAKWFEAREGRESPQEGLARELKEELSEIGVNIEIPNRLPLRLIRRIHEGPEKVHGQTYFQFRQLDVYAISPSAGAEHLSAHLVRAARTHKDLLLANAEQIVSGRAEDGRLISHTSIYLLQRRRLRPDLPPFAHSPR